MWLVASKSASKSRRNSLTVNAIRPTRCGVTFDRSGHGQEGMGEHGQGGPSKEAISSPLLETSIEGATGVLYNITGSSNLTLTETSDAAEIIRAAVDEDAEIIYGTSIDESMGDAVMITLIATGFDDRERVMPISSSRSSPPVASSRRHLRSDRPIEAATTTRRLVPRTRARSCRTMSSMKNPASFASCASGNRHRPVGLPYAR